MSKKTVVLWLSLIFNLLFVLATLVAAIVFHLPERLLRRYVAYPMQLNWQSEVDNHAFYNTLMEEKEHTVLLVGNSILDGFNWHEALPGFHVINRAIPGEATGGVLRRLNNLKAIEADQVVLMIGINDVMRGMKKEKILDNLFQIMEALDSTNKTLIVHAIIYNRTERDSEAIDFLNQRLDTYCKKRALMFVDLNPKLSEHRRLQLQYTYDGIHLNSAAYRIWHEELVEILNMNKAK